MSDIKPIENDYVTIKGLFGVINHGNGYAIVNVQTKEYIARNISSFLDCIKTMDYLLGNIQDENTETNNQRENSLNQLDMATIRSMAQYFARWSDTIIKYHRDHNATYEEAQIISQRYIEIAAEFNKVRTLKELKNVVGEVEIFKIDISRFKHREHKYRWERHLQKDVLDKLNPILSKC
jgi:hypothetical protein